VRWRDGVVGAVGACTEDTVIVSHFVAINAVIGAALGDDRVLIRSLDNCSRTVVETTADGIVLIEGGTEADTLIR
jgi:broad specificity phosphatase PhoE